MEIFILSITVTIVPKSTCINNQIGISWGNIRMTHTISSKGIFTFKNKIQSREIRFFLYPKNLFC